jgi:hypothetical protein
MKNLLLITVLSIAIGTQSCEQKASGDSTPEKVLSTFNQKFPNAKDVEWEKEDATEWEAEFNMDGKEYSANFSVNGDWKETEYEIEEADLPADIRALLDQNFSDYEIEEAEIAETAAGKSFELAIEVGEEEFEVVIDSQGNLTKKKEIKESGDQDGD